MFAFVGAEYIIANLLLVMKRKQGRSIVSFSELNDLGIFIQKRSIEKDLNAVFLTSQDQYTLALFDFSDYFDYDEARQTICIRQTKQITDLASRFVGYLPWEVLTFLVETTNDFVQKSIVGKVS